MHISHVSLLTLFCLTTVSLKAMELPIAEIVAEEVMPIKANTHAERVVNQLTSYLTEINTLITQLDNETNLLTQKGKASQQSLMNALLIYHSTIATYIGDLREESLQTLAILNQKNKKGITVYQLLLNDCNSIKRAHALYFEKLNEQKEATQKRKNSLRSSTISKKTKYA